VHRTIYCGLEKALALCKADVSRQPCQEALLPTNTLDMVGDLAFNMREPGLIVGQALLHATTR